MRRLLRHLTLALVVTTSTRAFAQEEDEKRAQARTFFESGLAHFDRGELSAALADFMKSRELFPTRTATVNAAVCLRKESRFDEALSLLEEVLRAYPDLAPQERTFIEKEIVELRPLVGSIDITAGEPGASIVIDGRERGSYPSSGPLRVSAGTHIVRIYKQGFVQLERTVVVAGKQTVAFDASLTALTASGRLVVTEVAGKNLEVVVDNVTIGKTPFEGSLPIGRHTVSLRGDADLGTAPVDTVLVQGQVTTLGLVAETLDSSLRVVPIPASAEVSIDGVFVGHGVWEGKLRSGEHKIEIAADGFVAQAKIETLGKGVRSNIEIGLDRDMTTAQWKASHPARLYLELDGGPGIGLVFGGDVRDACTGECSTAIPLGLGARIHGGYELSSRVLLGIDAGLFALAAGTSNRATTATPQGLGGNAGAADDDLYLRGFCVGPSIGYRIGEKLPITIRLGAGMFFGSGGDARRGSFTSSAGARYDVDLSESSRAIYVYAAPEVRIAKPIAGRLEANVGIAFLVLAAIEQPSWTDRQSFVAGPPGQAGDGLARFGAQSIAGTFVFAAAPSVGLRYAF